MYRSHGLFSIKNIGSLILMWLGFICVTFGFNGAFGIGGNKERAEEVASAKKRNDFYKLEKKELNDFEFKSYGSKLRVPDVNNQRAITAFWKYCKDCKHAKDLKTLVTGFSREYVEAYDAIAYFYKRVGEKEFRSTRRFLDMDIMIENIALKFRKEREAAAIPVTSIKSLQQQGLQ